MKVQFKNIVWDEDDMQTGLPTEAVLEMEVVLDFGLESSSVLNNEFGGEVITFDYEILEDEWAAVSESGIEGAQVSEVARAYRIAALAGLATEVVGIEPKEADFWACEAGQVAWDGDFQAPEKLASHPELAAAFKRGFNSAEQQAQARNSAALALLSMRSCPQPISISDTASSRWRIIPKICSCRSNPSGMT